MSYLGDFRTSSTVICRFTTVTTTGAPTQLAGTPAISVYKNSTTQSTSGVTLTVDYDTVTGFNHVAVDTSSDGTFYAAGNDFDVVITTGTVGGTSVVGYVVGTFSLENRSALLPTTSGRKLDVSAGGEAGVDWANVGSPTTAVDLSATTISTAQQVDATKISGDAATADNLQTAFQTTLAESSAIPAANASIWAKIAFLATKARNKITQTSTTQTLYADDGTTPVGTSTVSDNGTTATRGEFT